MYNTRKVTNDLVWLGASDNRLNLFENIYPIPNGISYNSYLLNDEKTVLFDTVDSAVRCQFFENLQHELHGRPLDYLIIHHMEPDHCAELASLECLHPETKIVCNAQIKRMIEQFFELNLPEDKFILVKEGDTLTTGKHTLTFVMAPMVHWPEVMVTYDSVDKILFTADAFGTFGSLNGNIFADEVEFATRYLYETRRYYTNIVGKYGPQVQNLLKKAAALDIKILCPLHGFIWRNNLSYIIDKYTKWATYEPEEKGVMLLYGSVYGNTRNAVEILACKLADMGVKNIQIYDVSNTHQSYIVSEAFKYSVIVLAAATYNTGVFVNMETVLRDIVDHNLQNRTFALIENGSWAPTAAKSMKETLSKLKNCTILESSLTIKSALKYNQTADIEAMAEAIKACL